MIDACARRPVAVTMLCSAAALLGVAAWMRIPVELLPETEFPRLSVVAAWDGASPEITEAMLTSPIEAAAQRVRGVESVSSLSEQVSGTGMARVDVRFAHGTDMDFARLELTEWLAALDETLPDGASVPHVERYVPKALDERRTPFLAFTAASPDGEEVVRAHVDSVLAPEIRHLDGVAGVEVEGGRERLVEIRVDEARALALGLDTDALRRQIREIDIAEAGGVVRLGGTEHPITLRHRAESIGAIRQLPILTKHGQIVRVQDVATVRHTYEEPASHHRVNGQPAVSFTVHKKRGTDAVELADQVKERIAALAHVRPPRMRVLLDEDESAEIRAQFADLRVRMLSGALVVLAVLVVFLRSYRSAALVFCSVALSILVTLGLVHAAGLTLNLLTLMGLAMAFGLVLDNAVVVVENVYRRRALGDSVMDSVRNGSREMVMPVLAATLTTAIVFVPFLHLQGELRVVYVPFAIVVGLANLASLLVTFTLIPAAAGRLAGRGPAGGGTASPVYLRVYRRLIESSLRRPWLVVTSAFLLLGASGYLFQKHVTFATGWHGSGDDPYIEVRARLPRGESLERADEVARAFDAELASIPHVERFSTTVLPERVHIRVSFPDSVERGPLPLHAREQLAALGKRFGGADVNVYGFGPAFYGGSTAPPSYQIQILGYNYEQVRALAEDLAQRLRGFPRIHDVDIGAAAASPGDAGASEVVLRIDRDRLAMHPLTARDVAAHVALAVGRQFETDAMRLGGEEMGFALRTGEPGTPDVERLRELAIPTRSGQPVRLGAIVDLELREVPSRIAREDQQYQRIVTYEFRGPVELGDRLQDAAIAATRVPDGYKLTGREDRKWSRQDKSQTWQVLLVALVLVFMVTAALFESLRLPACVLLTVPMALIGVFLSFVLAEAPFTREALIGVVMMSGVVVNNSVLLVHHIRQLRRDGEESLPQAILRGTVERVRPILMTNAVTILGLLPLVLFGGSPAGGIWSGLSYSLLGGLTSSTLLVLTVTPALYLVFERGRERRTASCQG